MGLYYSLNKEYNIKKFYKKRLLRIIPPVVIVTSIVTCLSKSAGIKTFLKKYLWWKYSLMVI